MKGRNIIDKLEEQSRIPDKLEPECIKEMLDKEGLGRAVIRDEPEPEEIRLLPPRAGVLKSIAAAAVFVLAVGGMAYFALGQSQGKVRTTPRSQPPQTADCTDLDGLRGGSYKSLYNFLEEKSSSHYNTTGVGYVDVLYAYSGDKDSEADSFESDKTVSQTFRRLYRPGDDLWTDELRMDVLVAGEENDACTDGSALLLKNGSDAFAGGLTNVYAYRMQGGETRPSDFDFMGSTHIMELMKDNQVFKDAHHTPKVYILDLRLRGDRLIVTYDLHLPGIYGEKNLMQPYCGISVFDVSDIDNISLVYEYEQPGVMTNASLAEDGSLIILSQYTNAKETMELTGFQEDLGFLPAAFENGRPVSVDQGKIYISKREESPSLIYASRFAFRPSPDSETAGRYNAGSVTGGIEGSAVKPGKFYRDTSLLLAMKPDSTVIKDGEVLLTACSSETVVDRPGNYHEQYYPFFVKLSKPSEKEGFRVTRARYIDSHTLDSIRLGELTDARLTDCTHENGFWYMIMAMGGDVMVLDEDMNAVYGYDPALPDQIPNGIWDMRGVLRGSRYYYFASYQVTDEETEAADYMSDTELCLVCADLGDPGDPVITELPEDAVILDRGDNYLLGNDLAVTTRWNYTPTGVDDEGFLTYDVESVDLEFFSTLAEKFGWREKEILGTGVTYTYIGEDGEPVELPPETVRSAVADVNRANVKVKGDESGNEGPDWITFYHSPLTGTFSDDGAYITIPWTETSFDCHLVTDEELTFEDMERVLDFTREEGYVYRILDRAEYKASAKIFVTLPGKGDPEYLCDAAAPGLESDREIENGPEMLGAIYMNGKVYVFTDIGVGCTNLKNGALLYSGRHS